MKRIAATIALLVATLGMAAPAEAVRPIVGYDYPDVCKNIEGTQTVLDIARGDYQFKVKRNGKRHKNKCEAGWRTRTYKG